MRHGRLDIGDDTLLPTPRRQRRDQLAIGCRQERVPLRFQSLANRGRVGDVPVMRHHHLAQRALVQDWLGVLQAARSRRRIARVSDGNVPFELPQDVLREHLRDQPHVLVEADFLAVGDCNPRALLTAMLQRIEAKVRGATNVLAGAVDAEYPARLARRPLPATRIGPVVLKLALGGMLSGHVPLSPRSVAGADIRPSIGTGRRAPPHPVIEPRVPSVPRPRRPTTGGRPDAPSADKNGARSAGDALPAATLANAMSPSPRRGGGAIGG